MKKVLKTLLTALLAFLLFIVLLWGGLNLVKYAIYPTYYATKTDVCDNPGLNEGFVCQGVTMDEISGQLFVSGYMKDKTASRIYITDTASHARFVTLMRDGKAFKGHAGGIAVHADTVYVVSGRKIYRMDRQTLLNARPGEAVELGEGVAINNAGSFIFADDTYVYVGEYNDGDAYQTNHPFATPTGTNYAILSRYTHENLSAPDRIYSIRNVVQGMCMTDDGQMVLSTSCGLQDSVFCFYNADAAVDSGLTLDGAPVYYLPPCTREIRGPAMAEGLDFTDGKVITLFESASDKYIFGKFFFATKIVALEP